MIEKGDAVLVTSGKSKLAGKIGIVKRIVFNRTRAIVEIFNTEKDSWIKIEDLFKLSENQTILLKEILKEK